MEVKYYGANCLRFIDRKIAVTVDDCLTKVGLKTVTKPEDICIFTDTSIKDCAGRFLVNGPGEYEISDISIRGISAKDMLGQNEMKASIYRIEYNNFSIGIIGNIYPELDDGQLESLGVVDVLCVPVGGNGYTVDAHGATQLIKKIEPKIVIPTHYASSGVNYEVPQASLENFLKEMGITDYESVDTFKLKESELGDKTRLVVLKISNQ